jgi:hypothetical protein
MAFLNLASRIFIDGFLQRYVIIKASPNNFFFIILRSSVYSHVPLLYKFICSRQMQLNISVLSVPTSFFCMRTLNVAPMFRVNSFLASDMIRRLSALLGAANFVGYTVESRKYSNKSQIYALRTTSQVASNGHM